MERKILLKNVGKTPLQITWHHDVVCAFRKVCTCKTINQQQKGSKPIRLEASTRININETSEPLPAALLRLPQVQHCLKSSPPVLQLEALVSNQRFTKVINLGPEPLEDLIEVEEL